MTRLTHAMIQSDDNVYATSYGQVDSKFGLYIGTIDESPSGSPRLRTLLTSDSIYLSVDEAQATGVNIIAECRQCTTVTGE